MQFNLRCDSPALRRFVELTITPEQDGDVLFDSCTIWTEERPLQLLLTKGASRTADLLIVCSWCEKVDVGKKKWQEVEEAVKTLGLFEMEKLPSVSHGICSTCYQEMSKKLKIFKPHKIRF